MLSLIFIEFVQVYPVGSSVMLKNMQNAHRMGGKMDLTWKGPYTIQKMVGKGRYQLKTKNGQVLKKLYNGILLKEYYSTGADHQSTTPEKICQYLHPILPILNLHRQVRLSLQWLYQLSF